MTPVHSRLLPALILLLPIPALAAPDVGPAKGALVVVGGGSLPKEIRDRFVQLAGGPKAKFIVIPTAEEGEPDLERAAQQFQRQFGVESVTVLHTRDPKRADTEEFVSPLKQANAVWFGGGRQWRFTDAYLGTRTEREIRAVLDRGGVIGGSSAGATIQGSYLVRGAPEGNTIMMAKGHEQGFGYLKNVAIDQHILARRREADMAQVVKAYPELLGIGIDEGTAIVVEGDRFEIIGKSQVAITDGKDRDGKPYYLLSVGDKFDLKERKKLVVAPSGARAWPSPRGEGWEEGVTRSGTTPDVGATHASPSPYYLAHLLQRRARHASPLHGWGPRAARPPVPE